MSYLHMKGISKSFPGVRALSNVDFEAEKGEVHAIAGENGAGKSTLIKILSGAYLPDEGQIFLDGKELSITDPHSGREQGISVIYQELSLIPNMTVAENIFLANMPKRLGAVKWQEMRQRSHDVLQEIGFDISPNAKVRDLSIVQQQAVEIAKILVEETKIVVMDEPTALLPPREVKTLFEVINKLRAKGVTVLYISHRLDELFQIADRITVLRDGTKIGTVKPQDINQDELIQMMIGRKPAERQYWKPERAEMLKNAPVVLEVEGLGDGKNLKNVSLSVRKGEILGIAGLVGSGNSEILQCIFGAKQAVSGRIKIQGKEIKSFEPATSIKNSLAFLPADRKNLGLVLGMTIKRNISLTGLDQLSNFFVVKNHQENAVVDQLIKKLRIKSRSREQMVETLSGGNQQKVVMAKWLLPECQILMFDEPTRGIDVGARSEIYELMLEYVDQGGTIVMVSSDMQELLAVCDRIIVIGQGQVTAVFDHEEATEEKIGMAMF
ncbi:MAG TPA: sugar ABC transporter ATP-binding protein [Syntrophomonadaceae bacterium]|nr:sugar ABC transporter ATP-binding protein [Syntrophomonadaceae bacterium]HQA07228.1 sugar ABC transporter ATP-binding protein [Syntrophomonadaceae bacterium]HQE22417.1 sugar ABC transporter ATP-binding protein [Syntrophomonadaceae bacterium]